MLLCGLIYGQGMKQQPSTSTLCAQIAASILPKTLHGLPPRDLILYNLLVLTHV